MMAEEITPTCIVCKTNSSLTWKKNLLGQFTCGRCSCGPVTVKRTTLRKSTRAKSSRCRQSKVKEIIKGKSRRDMVFKKQPPTKALKSQASVVTLDYLIYEEQYYQIGDIISMLYNDNLLYGQIYGMVIDEFGEKSAYIRWLKPMIETAIFDPQDFAVDFEDDLPRKFQFLNFVSRAPNYFFPKCDEYNEQQHSTKHLATVLRLLKQGAVGTCNLNDVNQYVVSSENEDTEELDLNQEIHAQVDLNQGAQLGVDVQQREITLIDHDQEDEVSLTGQRFTVPSAKYCANSSEIECTSSENSNT